MLFEQTERGYASSSSSQANLKNVENRGDDNGPKLGRTKFLINGLSGPIYFFQIFRHLFTLHYKIVIFRIFDPDPSGILF